MVEREILIKEATPRTKLACQNFITAAILVLIGITIATLPHIVEWLKTGDPAWFAGRDDLLYLSTASATYHNNSLFLIDPVPLAIKPLPVYPWFLFAPGIVLAKSIGLAPIYINIIWRIFAGLTIPLMLFLVSRLYLKNTWLASVATIIMMTDTGVLTASLFYKHFITVFNIATGSPKEIFQTFPRLLIQWRIITPGLSLAYLLLHIWLLVRALINPARFRIILAGVGFGLLFYVYFYYWTAVTLALIIAMFLDRPNHKIYLKIGVLGIFIGLPQIIWQICIKFGSNTDWLTRTDKFIFIPHFSELSLPKMTIFILFASFLWIMFRRRDFIYLWSLGISGLMLANHQIISGLQIENGHWFYCWGPIISLLALYVLLEILFSTVRKKYLMTCGVVLLTIYLATGYWLRYLEAVQTKESVSSTNAYHRYRDQHLRPEASHFLPRSVVAGFQDFVDFSVITDNQRPLTHYVVLFSPSVNNSEWGRRFALNSYLVGISSKTIFTAQRELSFFKSRWGPWARNSEYLTAVLKEWQKYFDEVAADPMAAIKHFQVRYVVLPAHSEQPGYLNSGWKIFEDGPYWRIWESEK